MGHCLESKGNTSIDKKVMTNIRFQKKNELEDGNSLSLEKMRKRRLFQLNYALFYNNIASF